jgi:hypothetical protein
VQGAGATPVLAVVRARLVKGIAVMQAHAALAHRRGRHRLPGENRLGQLQVERLARRRHVVVDRALVRAVAEVEAAVLERRVVERDPGGDDAIAVGRAEIEVVLMRRLGTAALGRLEEDLAEVDRDAGAEDLLDQRDQARFACQCPHRGPMRVRVVELSEHRSGAHAGIDVPGALLRRKRGEKALGPGLDVGDHAVGIGRIEHAVDGEVALVAIKAEVDGVDHAFFSTRGGQVDLGLAAVVDRSGTTALPKPAHSSEPSCSRPRSMRRRTRRSDS